MRKITAVLLGAAAFASNMAAYAEDVFPSRPLRMIVVYPAGGGADILSRTLADAVAREAGQPMIVENRPGANGMIGTAACKNAAADGYTYCMVLSDVLTINPFIYKSVPYDAEKDLAPVASIANVVGVFTTHEGMPVSNLKELAVYSHDHKGKTNWGTWGVGSSAHLLMEQMNKSMGADLTQVPYQGVPQIINALLTNEIGSTMILYGPMAQYIQTGKLKPLAVLGDKRLPQLPNVPTANEQGLNFPTTLWYGVFAPAGTRKPMVEKMSGWLNKALGDPAVDKILQAQGFTPLGEGPQPFAQRVAQDRKVWGPVAKGLNLKLD